MRYLLIALTLFTALTVHAQEPIETKIAAANKDLLPRGWEIHTVDEGAWNAAKLRYGMQVADRAFTVFQGERKTYIRESYAERATPAQLHHTFAHEAGHVACACRIEQVAEDWANRH